MVYGMHVAKVTCIPLMINTMIPRSLLQLCPAHTSHHLCLVVQSLLLATSDGGTCTV